MFGKNLLIHYTCVRAALAPSLQELLLCGKHAIHLWQCLPRVCCITGFLCQSSPSAYNVIKL